jgi:hypothetical protein
MVLHGWQGCRRLHPSRWRGRIEVAGYRDVPLLSDGHPNLSRELRNRRDLRKGFAFVVGRQDDCRARVASASMSRPWASYHRRWNCLPSRSPHRSRRFFPGSQPMLGDIDDVAICRHFLKSIAQREKLNSRGSAATQPPRSLRSSLVLIGGATLARPGVADTRFTTARELDCHRACLGEDNLNSGGRSATVCA